MTAAAPTVGGGEVYISPLEFGDDNRRSLLAKYGPVPGEAFLRALVERPTETVAGLLEVADWPTIEPKLVKNLLHACECQGEAEQAAAKAQLPGFVPAHFDPDGAGSRRKEWCIGRQVIGHDFDHFEATDWDDVVRKIRALLPDRFLAIHATPRSTENLWRVRVYELLDREATPAEWDARVKPHMRRMGCHDANALDVTRFFFLPVLTPSYRYAVVDGPWTRLDGLPLAGNAPPPAAPPSAPAISARDAAAALLASAWPAKGRRHLAQLALAGALCRDGWSEADAVELLCDVCRHAGDEDRPKRAATCRETWAKAAVAASYTGWSTLAQHVGEAVVAGARAMLRSPAEHEARERFAERFRAPGTAPGTNGVASGGAAAPATDEDDSWRRELETVTTKRGEVVVPTLGNAAIILERHRGWRGVLAFDAFRYATRIMQPPPWGTTERPATQQPTEWTDTDSSRLAVWLQREESLKVARHNIEGAVAIASEQNAAHEVRDYLDSRRWDGTSRVDVLCTRYLGAAPSDYARAVGRSLLLSAVARIMDPGCQVDTMVILEGDQGTGKSRAIRTLASAAWFSDSSIELGEKDSYQQLVGVWFYELSELDALSRRDVSRVKAFISGRVDRYRPSYGRRAIAVPRQVIFVGTTNKYIYLFDETGGRRFLPLRTGTIALDALAADRDQLWAEAVHRFRQGEAWHLAGSLARAAAAEADERFQIDPWETVVATWLAGEEKVPSFTFLAGPERAPEGAPERAKRRREEGATTEGILREALGVDTARQTRTDAMRVGAILRRLDWLRGGKETRVDGTRRYVYRPAPPKRGCPTSNSGGEAP